MGVTDDVKTRILFFGPVSGTKKRTDSINEGHAGLGLAKLARDYVLLYGARACMTRRYKKEKGRLRHWHHVPRLHIYISIHGSRGDFLNLSPVK